MALFLKPHTVLVEVVSETTEVNLRVDNLVFADGIEVQCQISAADAVAVYQQFGIESKQPHKLLCDLDDADYFTIGTRVLWDSRTFAVTSPKRISKHGLPTDHASVMLEELDL